MLCWSKPYVHVGGVWRECVQFWLCFLHYSSASLAKLATFINHSLGFQSADKPTFNCVPEALRGGGIERWGVKGVKLKTVQNILGLWQPLHHGTGHISCWISPNGARLCICVFKNTSEVKGVMAGIHNRSVAVHLKTGSLCFC